MTGPATDNRQPLEQALLTALTICGIDILKNPTLVRNTLRDIGDVDELDTELFLQSCNQELLLPFYHACMDDETPLRDGLLHAALEAATYLSDKRRIMPQDSKALALTIANAIASYLASEHNVPISPLMPDDLDADSPSQGEAAKESHSRKKSVRKEKAKRAKGSKATGPSKKTAIAILGICTAVAGIIFAGWMLLRSPLFSPITITLVANTSPSDSETKTIRTREGAKVELPSDAFTRDGYQLAGWSRKREDVTEDDVLATGHSVLSTDSRSYYAVWTPLVYFDGSGADTGELSPMAASLSGQVTLPDNPYEKERCKFGGWTIDNDDTVYAAGDVAAISEPSTCRAVWRAQIRFDGNGATRGTTKAIYCNAAGRAKLPSCGYELDGYEFAGWTDESGFDVYQPGDRLTDQHEPLTLYATWKFDSSVAEAMHVETTEQMAANGSRTLFLFVRNDSGRTVDLRLNATFESSTTQDVEWQDEALAFAAGDETLFVCPDDSQNGGSGIGSFTYSLEAQPPKDGTKSLQGKYSIEEIGISKGQPVTVRIINTSSDTLHIQLARVYATQPGYGSNGGFAFYYGDIDKTELPPGDSTYMTFGNNTDDVSWSDLKREYYLYGYASD